MFGACTSRLLLSFLSISGISLATELTSRVVMESCCSRPLRDGWKAVQRASCCMSSTSSVQLSCMHAWWQAVKQDQRTCLDRRPYGELLLQGEPAFQGLAGGHRLRQALHESALVRARELHGGHKARMQCPRPVASIVDVQLQRRPPLRSIVWNSFMRPSFEALPR